MTYKPPESPIKVLQRVRVPLLSSYRRWPDPSPDDVRALWAAMCAHYNVRVVDKNNSAEMQRVADFLDKLGIVDKERFLHNFVTTLGSDVADKDEAIYTPFTPGIPVGNWTLWQQTMVIGHEITHVLQDRSMEGILFEYQYASNSTKRAFFEMEGYRVQMTLAWIFRGEELNPLGLATLLSDAYGCDMADVEMVAKMLTVSMVAIKKGAIPGKACQFEVDWLKARWS